MVRVSAIRRNNATDSVEVSVISHEGLGLNDPHDIEYTEGDIGNTITWTVNTISSFDYWVYRNGEDIFSGNQDDELVTLNIDYLVAGSYNFTLSVRDSYGREAVDTVWVSVLQRAEDELVSLITNPLVLTAVGITVVGVLATRSAVRSRRRSQWKRDFGSSWALDRLKWSAL